MPFTVQNIPILKGHYRPWFYEDLAHGDPVETWYDEGGYFYDITQPDPDAQPLYEVQAVNGWPALKFDGVDDFMTGVDFDLFLDDPFTPSSNFFVSLYVSDVATQQYIVTETTGQVQMLILANGKVRIVCGATTLESTEPLEVGWHVLGWVRASAGLRLCVDDPYHDVAAAASAPSSTGTLVVGANPAMTGDFLGGATGGAMMSEMVFFDFDFIEGGTAKVMIDLMKKVGVGSRGDPLAQGRDTISRRMVANERSRMFVNIDVPLGFLNYDLLTPFAITSQRIPDPSGHGSGVERWARRSMNLLEQVETVGEHRLSLGFADRDRVGHMYRESGVADFTHEAKREGVAISGYGPRRIFNHQTLLYTEAPSGIVMETAPGVEPGTALGIFADPTSRNYLLRTSFTSGLDGLTTSGTGVNGSAVTVIPTENSGPRVLFDPIKRVWVDKDEPRGPGVTTNYIKLQAGTPHAADLTVQWPLTIVEEPIPADERLCFSIDVCNTGGEGYWALQNDVDSEWWDDANETWSATIVWNELPFDPDPEIFRERSNVITWPSTAGRALMLVGLPNGQAVDGSSMEVFHVQLEPYPFPTSRWPQDDAYVSDRTECILGFFENATARMFNEPRGTVACRLTPPWSAADLAAGNAANPGGLVASVFQVQYVNPPVDSFWELRLNALAGTGFPRWEWIAANLAADLIAYQNTDLPERNAEIALVVRWTSEDEGELGLPANTLDIFANGVKGVTAEITGLRPAVIANSRVRWDLLGASVRDVHFDYRVWSDEECAAW